MNDIEMLNCILQNAEMGCQGIAGVRRRIKHKAVDSVLCTQLARYGKIYSAANSMLKSRGVEARRISPVAKTLTGLAAQRDLRRGNTMGVNKMVRHLRNYDRANPNITLLAKKMIDTEEEHIRELRAFI